MGSDDADGVSCCEDVDTGVDPADEDDEGAGAPLNKFLTSNLGLLAAAAAAGLAAGVAMVGGGVADVGGFEGGLPLIVTEDECECAAAMEPKLLTPSPLTAGVGVAAGDDERGAAASSMEPKVTGEVPICGELGGGEIGAGWILPCLLTLLAVLGMLTPSFMGTAWPLRVLGRRE